MNQRRKRLKWLQYLKGLVPIASEEGSADVFITHRPPADVAHAAPMQQVGQLCHLCHHLFNVRYMLEIVRDTYLCTTCAVNAGYVDAEDITVTDSAVPP